MSNVTITISLNDDFIEDIIDAAGYGVGYWAAHAVVMDDGGYIIEPQAEYITDVSKPGRGPVLGRYALIPDTIALAIERLLTNAVDVQDDVVQTVFEAVRDNDASEIDAGIADVIIQTACFYEDHGRKAILFG